MKILTKNGRMLICGHDTYLISIPMSISHDNCNGGYCVNMKKCWVLYYNDIVIGEYTNIDDAKNILLTIYHNDDFNKIKIVEDPAAKVCYERPIIRSDADTCDDFIKEVCEKIDRGEITDIDKFLDKLRNSSTNNYTRLKYTVLI